MIDFSEQDLSDEDKKVVRFANVLKAISHPVRLCIVKKLYLNRSCNVGYFTGCLNISQSGVSQHLTKLRDLGIVEARRKGTEIYYQLIHEDVIALVKKFLVEDKNE